MHPLSIAIPTAVPPSFPRIPVSVPVKNIPFFTLLSESGVASSFLKAMITDAELARSYVSKYCVVDFENLRDILSETWIPLMTAEKSRRGSATRSVLVRDLNCILHLHMVREPGPNGPWKICGIDKE
jgi:hypothetical protein